MAIIGWPCSAPWPAWPRARASRWSGWRRRRCPTRASPPTSPRSSGEHSHPGANPALGCPGVPDGQVQLTGVPETTLYYRATEARRPDAVIRDSKAVELVDAIDYPFEERFGRAVEWQAQWQGLRARRFDTEVRRFLREHPGGTVIAL